MAQWLEHWVCNPGVASSRLTIGTYTSTVASKLFNFSPALSNLNVSEYFSNPQTCQCKEFKFCYEPHGHVITGDLRVIENAKLRELVAKGPKYREPNKVNWKAMGNNVFEIH